MERLTPKRKFILAALLATLPLSGCAKQPDAAPPAQLTQEQRNSTDPQVKAIVNDPSIPEAQKAAAIQAAQGRAAQAQATGK